MLMAVVVAMRYQRAAIATVAMLLACAAVSLLVARLRVVLPGDVAPVVFVVDISASHQPVLKERWPQIREQIAALAGSAGVPSLVVFADSEPRVVVRGEPGEVPELPDSLPPARDLFATSFDGIASIDAAKRARRVVVVSDGAFDRDGLRLAFPGATMYSLPISEALEDAARIEGVSLPSVTDPGVGVTAEVRVRGAPGSNLTLLIKRGPGPDDQVLTMDLGVADGASYVHEALIPGEWLSNIGLVTVEFEVKAYSRRDLLLENNRHLAVTMVGGSGPALYVSRSATPKQDGLFQLLVGLGLDVQAVPPKSMVSGFLGLAGAHMVVLNDVPLVDLPERGEPIRALVETLGVSLLVVGAEHAFGPGGYDGSRLELALPLDANPNPGKPRQHVLLLDVSDSMGESVGGRQRIALLREAVATASLGMDTEDHVALIPFAQNPRVARAAFVSMDASGKAALATELASMTPGGGTSILGALRGARDALEDSGDKTSTVPPRVLLISDGDSPSDALKDFDELARSLAKRGAELRIVLLENGDVPAWIDRLQVAAPKLALEVIRVPELARLAAELQDLQSRESKARYTEQPVAAKWLGFPNPPANGTPSATTINGRARVALKTVGTPTAFIAADQTNPTETHAAWWRYGAGMVAAAAIDCAGDKLNNPTLSSWIASTGEWLLHRVPLREFEARMVQDADGVGVVLSRPGDGEPLPLTAVISGRLLPDGVIEPGIAGHSLNFTRISDHEWRAKLANTMHAGVALVVPEIRGVGSPPSPLPESLAQTRRQAIAVALGCPEELRPPLDSPRKLKALIADTGGQVFASDVRSFPDKLLPIEEEERRVTWALAALILVSLGVAIWYRRRMA